LTTPIGPPHLKQGKKGQTSGLTKGRAHRTSVSRRGTGLDLFLRSVRVRYLLTLPPIHIGKSCETVRYGECHSPSRISHQLALARNHAGVCEFQIVLHDL
jgi:hypothetical protein